MRYGNRTAARVLAFVGLGLGCPVVAGQADVGGKPSDEQKPTTRSAEEGTWLRVTADRVNVRSRPDANSVVVARIERDTVLRAVARDPYGWYRILPPEGVFSYVSAEHIDRRGPAEGIVSVRSGTLRVRVGSLVREVDPWQSEVQTLLKRGTPVQIVGQQGEWLKVVPPAGVHVYVSGDHVERVSDEIAARLRATSAGITRPAEGKAPDAQQTGATQPAAGPDLSGPWGRRLTLVETAIEAEADKPLLTQAWAEPIGRLRPIARQREEPMAARLAQAWIAQLEQRVAEQDAVRAGEEVLRRAARDRAQHEREMKRIGRARSGSTRPAFDARGELLRSYALEARDGRSCYTLRNPLTRRLEAYVEIAPESKMNPEKLLGQYVGVRGRRRFEPELGADVLCAEEIVVLKREVPATRPARQGP